jgi:uracil-DNA glycosylase
MSEPDRFPFGTEASARPPSADGPRPVFILGAYPSAMHARWIPPEDSGFRQVKALPVADEPSPFWNGDDSAARVEAWSAAQNFDPATHGTFAPAPKFNGTAGQWVDTNVVAALACTRADTWITDCLDTYRLSNGARKALDDTYDSARARYGWPAWHLRGHPSDDEVARESLSWHKDRLRAELAACQPELVVSLGNAALRVMGALLSAGPDRLEVAGYGERLNVGLGGRAVEWLPLAHPAAPQRYQEAHQGWMARAGSAA